MEKGDMIINTILSFFVAISATIIYENFKLDLTIIGLITFVIIALFWIGSFINEIDKRSKNNIFLINKIKTELDSIKKDLNIEGRLSSLENWRDNMRKRGEINVVDIIKIIAVIIFVILLLKAFAII